MVKETLSESVVCRMTKLSLSYAGRRILALNKGKTNIDDFGNPRIFTIYNPSRDLVITCNENNLSWWLEHTNE